MKNWFRRVCVCFYSSNGRLPFKKLLIANRGEIACRIIRTARRLGIPKIITVHSAREKNALHVRMSDHSIPFVPSPDVLNNNIGVG